VGARGWEVAGETNGNMHAGNHAPPGRKWTQEPGAYIPLGFADSVLCAGVERAWIGVAGSGREWKCKAWELVELETSTRGSLEHVLAGESRVDGVEKKKKKGWRRLGGRGLFIWAHLWPRFHPTAA
jgi:hypothetical protein